MEQQREKTWAGVQAKFIWTVCTLVLYLSNETTLKIVYNLIVASLENLFRLFQDKTPVGRCCVRLVLFKERYGNGQIAGPSK
jgi:uncharacterized protein (DUF608 family)